jgi:hypothetical protein
LPELSNQARVLKLLRAGLAGVCVLLAGALAMADEAAAELKPGTRWHQSLVTILDTDFSGTGYQARWQYFNCPCGDVLIRLEEGAPDGVQSGELLLVAGRVVAGRGDIVQNQDLAPMLYAPALMMHLVSHLLERALPSGPAALGERQEISFKEASQAIEIDTGLATGLFPAPWQLSGSAWPSGEGRRRFQLSFSFANPQPDDPGRVDSIELSGGQDYLQGAFPLLDEASLYGWNLQWLTEDDEAAELVTDELLLSELRAQALTGR